MGVYEDHITTEFTIWGGIKARLAHVVAANGYANAMQGWGYEDSVFRTRLEKFAVPRSGVQLWDWGREIQESDRNQAASLRRAVLQKGMATMLNLEWDSNGAHEVAKQSNSYWRHMARQVRFVAPQPNWQAGYKSASHNKAAKFNRTWYTEGNRLRNWCFYMRQQQMSDELLSASHSWTA